LKALASSAGVVEAVKHGVHGGHADDVFVRLEDVQGAALQEFPLRWREAVADAAFHGLAVGRHDLANELGAGVGQQDVFEGGDGETGDAAGRVAHRLADLRVHHLNDDAD
jgi:hypothetical protein